MSMAGTLASASAGTTLPEGAPAPALLPDGSALRGKTLLFILTGGCHREPAYQQLRALGVRIVAVNPAVNWAEHLVDEWILADPADVTAMIRRVDAWLAEAGHPHIDGVTTFDEYGVFGAAALGQHLGVLPTPCPPEVVRQTSVKSHFRTHCASHGINTPRVVSVANLPELDALLEGDTFALAFPVIVKPSAGGGSAHIQYVASRADLRETCRAILSVLHSHRDARHWGSIEPVHLLIEEFLVGHEVDIDCVVQRGVLRYAAISDNRPTEFPYFRETGGVAPSLLPRHAQAALLAELQKWVSSHGDRINGILHYEAKYDPALGRATAVEVNLRTGGAETLCLNESVWGVSLSVAGAMLACGLDVPDLSSHVASPRCSVSSTNMLAPRLGYLTSQVVPQAVKDDPAFRGLCLYATAGDQVGRPPAAFTCLGWMCASGATADESEVAIARLESQLQFSVSDTPPEARLASQQQQQPRPGAPCGGPRGCGCTQGVRRLVCECPAGCKTCLLRC